MPTFITPRLRAIALALLFGVTFVSYFDRVNLSIAAEELMPALHLSKVQLGWVFNSFLIAYAIFQIPVGALADRHGPRIVLLWSTLAIGCVTLLTGLLPGRVGSALIILIALRFLLGVAESATFPVATEAVSRWVPVSHRGFGNSVLFMGSSIGSALSGPLVSWSMVHLGWRGALLASAIPGFVFGLLWLVFRHDPVSAPADVTDEGVSLPSTPWLTPNVLLLSLSYFAEGYLLFMFVSWLYIYLVEVRHFSLLAGGLVSSLPWMTAVGATPLGGLLADRLSKQIGRVRASQSIISAAYVASGGLLFVAAFAHTRAVSVFALSVSLGALYLAEPSFWTIASSFHPRRGATVSGFMNTIGILGGITSNALVPVLVSRFSWLAAFGSALLMGLLTAAVWLVLAYRLKRTRIHVSA